MFPRLLDVNWPPYQFLIIIFNSIYFSSYFSRFLDRRWGNCEIMIIKQTDIWGETIFFNTAYFRDFVINEGIWDLEILKGYNSILFIFLKVHNVRWSIIPFLGCYIMSGEILFKAGYFYSLIKVGSRKTRSYHLFSMKQSVIKCFQYFKC